MTGANNQTQLLRAVLWAAGIFAVAYLIAGAVGMVTSVMFPWDGIWSLFLIFICSWLYRYNTPTSVAVASGLIVAAATLLAAIYSQSYGLRGPAPAYLIIGILLASVLIGSWFSLLWTFLSMIFVLIWALAEQARPNLLLTSFDTAIDPVGTVIAGWWLIFLAGGLIAWLASQYMEGSRRLLSRQRQHISSALLALEHYPSLKNYLWEIVTDIARNLEAKIVTVFVIPQIGTVQSARFEPVMTFSANNEHLVIESPPAILAGGPLWQELKSSVSPLLIDRIGKRDRLENADDFLAYELNGLLLSPLHYRGEVIGYVSAGLQRQRRLRQDEFEFMSLRTAELSLALRLLELSYRKTSRAVETDRERIARDIHDTLAQGLTSIVIRLESALSALESDPESARQQIALAQTSAKQGHDEARHAIWYLHPQALESEDLASVLGKMTIQFSGDAEIEATLDVAGEPYRLSSAEEGELMRIAQEALTNTLRHAEAEHVNVFLLYTPQKVTLVVRDDGRGFDPDTVQSGFGLVAMRERAAQIGASLMIHAPLEGGSEVTCTVYR